MRRGPGYGFAAGIAVLEIFREHCRKQKAESKKQKAKKPER
jgi:hypothetical protein